MKKLNKNYGETFEYLGMHFIPYKKIRKNGTLRIASDFDLGFTKYEWDSKAPYDYQKFYEAMENSEADVFICKENDKLYIPGDNELFQYEG